MTNSQTLAILLSLGLLAGSCGDDGGGESTCGFEDRYLPYQPGYSWTYLVTDLVSGETPTKSQTLAMETDATLGEVIVQTTNKPGGITVSALKVQDDAVIRLRQEDRTPAGDLERTTVYDPYQTRLDESADRLVLGAEWDEVYTATITNADGTELPPVSRTDHWTVLGVDVACESPLGAFRCLHVRRARTAGGTSNKEYFFAKGMGKVKEGNASQIEELIACE